jgi:tetratricopeptide (TPR) repeat protein
VDPDEALALMQPAAEKALQLDPLLAEAHAAMGVVRARERNWKEAEQAFRRAIELNRSLSSVHMNFVHSTLWPQGKVGESLQQLRVALRADPLSLDLQRLQASVLVSAQRYDESIEIGRRVVAAEPTNAHARQVLARALFQKGERAEAVHILEQLGSGSHNMLGYAYAASGRRADAEKLAFERKDFPASVALIHAGLGNKDQAFEALERMADDRDPRVGAYLTYPEFASLLADPRMEALRRKLGITR